MNSLWNDLKSRSSFNRRKHIAPDTSENGSKELSNPKNFILESLTIKGSDTVVKTL